MEVPLCAVKGTDANMQKSWHTIFWLVRCWDKLGHYLEQEIAPEQFFVLEELTRTTSIQAQLGRNHAYSAKDP